MNKNGTSINRLVRTLVHYSNFLLAGILRHEQTGGILPSQRFLVNAMIGPVDPNYGREIIELGAGNGPLTIRLARKCPRAKIVACEINPTLARDLSHKVRECCLGDRINVVEEPAEQVLKRYRGYKAADYIISGIPLANLGKDRTFELIKDIYDSLRHGGTYVQFQHSTIDRGKIKSRFGNVETVPVWLNFPPAVVYYARK